MFLRTPGGVAGTLAVCRPSREFPTDYIKATPRCSAATYHPTFLYELLWNLALAAVLVWADRRFRLGGGQVFWLYVAGYTLGRGWIEMLRIDTANHFLGLRINVFTSIVLFLGRGGVPDRPLGRRHAKIRRSLRGRRTTRPRWHRPGAERPTDPTTAASTCAETADRRHRRRGRWRRAVPAGTADLILRVRSITALRVIRPAWTVLR